MEAMSIQGHGNMTMETIRVALSNFFASKLWDVIIYTFGDFMTNRLISVEFVP
jgi:hypothetical protein